MVEQKVEHVGFRARIGPTVGCKIISTYRDRDPSIAEPTRPALAACRATGASPLIPMWAAVIIGAMALVASMARAAPPSARGRPPGVRASPVPSRRALQFELHDIGLPGGKASFAIGEVEAPEPVKAFVKFFPARLLSIDLRPFVLEAFGPERQRLRVLGYIWRLPILRRLRRSPPSADVVSETRA